MSLTQRKKVAAYSMLERMNDTFQVHQSRLEKAENLLEGESGDFEVPEEEYER